MTIADDYYADAGETVGQACVRMHAAGFGIERAALLIGYATSSDLRKHLARRGLECPWPRNTYQDRRGRPPIRITDAAMERYVAMRQSGVLAKAAAADVGFSSCQIVKAIQQRRPDLSLPRGRTRGDRYRHGSDHQSGHQHR